MQRRSIVSMVREVLTADGDISSLPESYFTLAIPITLGMVKAHARLYHHLTHPATEHIPQNDLQELVLCICK